MGIVLPNELPPPTLLPILDISWLKQYCKVNTKVKATPAENIWEPPAERIYKYLTNHHVTLFKVTRLGYGNSILPHSTIKNLTISVCYNIQKNWSRPIQLTEHVYPSDLQFQGNELPSCTLQYEAHEVYLLHMKMFKLVAHNQNTSPCFHQSKNNLSTLVVSYFGKIHHQGGASGDYSPPTIIEL